MKRTPFTPEIGKTYENEGGGTYRCLRREDDWTSYTMQNVSSGWTLIAHGIGIYEDGKIDWDWSSGGHFEEVSK